jgi:hypothetical protein
MKSKAQEIANYCARKAWARYRSEGMKAFRQTVTDLDGKPHYCLCYEHDKTVTVHGVFNPKTGNYSVIRVKMSG